MPVRDGSTGPGGGAVKAHGGAADVDQSARQEVDGGQREDGLT